MKNKPIKKSRIKQLKEKKLKDNKDKKINSCNSYILFGSYSFYYFSIIVIMFKQILCKIYNHRIKHTNKNSKESFVLANEIAGAISKILCKQNFASDGLSLHCVIDLGCVVVTGVWYGWS